MTQASKPFLIFFALLASTAAVSASEVDTTASGAMPDHTASYVVVGAARDGTEVAVRRETRELIRGSAFGRVAYTLRRPSPTDLGPVRSFESHIMVDCDSRTAVVGDMAYYAGERLSGPLVFFTEAGENPQAIRFEVGSMLDVTRDHLCFGIVEDTAS